MVVPEFCPEKGKVVLVIRSLYGMKLSGENLRDLFSEQLHDLGYRLSISDPDVWMRPAVKPGGFMYS